MRTATAPLAGTRPGLDYCPRPAEVRYVPDDRTWYHVAYLPGSEARLLRRPPATVDLPGIRSRILPAERIATRVYARGHWYRFVYWWEPVTRTVFVLWPIQELSGADALLTETRAKGES